MGLTTFLTLARAFQTSLLNLLPKTQRHGKKPVKAQGADVEMASETAKSTY